MNNDSKVLTPEQVYSLVFEKDEDLDNEESNLLLIARDPLPGKLRYKWAQVRTYLEDRCDIQNKCPGGDFEFDCTHFICHALNAAGVFIRIPSAACASGLGIRVNDLAQSFVTSVGHYSNVTQITDHELTREGDFCFIPTWFGLGKNHALVLAAPATPQGARVWAHTNNRCDEFVAFEGQDCIYYRIDETDDDVSSWLLNGNANINESDFLGTIDNMPIVFKTNGTERIRVAAEGHVGFQNDVVVGQAGNARILVRHIDGKTVGTDQNDALFLNYATERPVSVGHSLKKANLLVSGDAVIGAGGNSRLLVRRIDGKSDSLDVPDALLINWNSGASTFFGQPSNKSSALISGNATVGAGGNGNLTVRHIEGKDFASDNADTLYLNYTSGKPVQFGRQDATSDILVTGDSVFGLPTENKSKVQICSTAPNQIALEVLSKNGAAAIGVINEKQAMALYAESRGSLSAIPTMGAINKTGGPAQIGNSQGSTVVSIGVLGQAGGAVQPIMAFEGGVGVCGVSAQGAGVVGTTQSSKFHAIEGVNTSLDGIGAGVYGRSTSSTGVGIYGENSAGGLAARFVGDVSISGALSAKAKFFEIDHPLNPERDKLLHASVESPEMLIIYSGNCKTDENGFSVITLPNYFGVLNIQPRYQLTAVGGRAETWIESEIIDNKFVIGASKPNLQVSWQVAAVRNDSFAQKLNFSPEKNLEINNVVNQRGREPQDVTKTGIS